MRTYITILHETVRVLVNFKHQIGYRYRLISALKISVIGTSAKSHIGASLILTFLSLILPLKTSNSYDKNKNHNHHIHGYHVFIIQLLFTMSGTQVILSAAASHIVFTTSCLICSSGSNSLCFIFSKWPVCTQNIIPQS